LRANKLEASLQAINTMFWQLKDIKEVSIKAKFAMAESDKE